MDEIFCRYRMLLATTIINRASSDPEKAVDYSAISNKINFEENFWWRGRLCKMLLLRNYEGGVCLLQQVFTAYSFHIQPKIKCSTSTVASTNSFYYNFSKL